MAVPNTFASATSSIPLANLDANFAYYDAGFSLSGSAVTFAGSITLTTGTANGVPYLNASKVLTSGAVLTFDGTTLSSTKFAGALNGTVGATTPTTGAFTTVSATGSIQGQASAAFKTNSNSGQYYHFDNATGNNFMGLDSANTVRIYAGGALSSTFTSTGLAVTGTLSATGRSGVTMSGQTSAVSFGQVSSDPTYGLLSFNGAFAATTLTGIWGGAGSPDMIIGVPTGGSIYSRVANSNVTVLSSTGLAVTGTLSATGAMTSTYTSTYFLSSTSAGTGSSAANIYNTSGNLILGVEGSAGGALVTGSTAYATILASYVNKPIQFGVNDTVRATISSTGLAVTGTLSATGTLSGGTSGTGYSFSGSAPAGSLALDSSGNLGIGTSSPAAKLDVNGGALIQGLTVGRGAGAVSTNTAVGASALAANTTGGNNTAIGSQALLVNTGSYSNIAIGVRALDAFNVTTATSTYNVAIGEDALGKTVTGINNTAIGGESLYENTASNNTAVGYQAGYSNTTGVIDAFGNQALRANTTGTNNTGIGNGALFSNTTGGGNIAMGNSAALLNTTGSNNTALGLSALYSNTTASNNTAVGYQAGYVGTTANNNSIFGYQTGYSITSGAGNCFIGSQAGRQTTTGSRNTFVGSTDNVNNYGAGFYITTGNSNTILGCYNGNQGGLDIRTSSNYIVLSDGDGNPRGIFDSSGNLLIGATSATTYTGNSVIVAPGGASPNGASISINHISGSSSGNYYLGFNYAGSGTGSITQSGTTAVLYNVTSDQRLKENIQDADSASTLVDALQVRQFDWKTDNTHQRYGFIAQELVTVAPEAVHAPADPDEMMAVDYSKLVPLLVKELQSLRARVAQLESKP